MRDARLVLLFTLVTAAAGCGPDPICAPGARVACFLADGTLGVDTCNSEGTAQSGCAVLPVDASLGCADVAASCCASLPEGMAPGCAAVVEAKKEGACNGYMSAANAVSLCTGVTGGALPAYGPACLDLMNGCCSALPSQMQSSCFSHGFLGNEERCLSYLDVEAKERGYCAEVDPAGKICDYTASSCCPTLPAGPRERCEALAAEGDADQCSRYLGQLALGNHCPTVGASGPTTSSSCDALIGSCCSTLDGSLATQCDLTGLSGQPALCKGYRDSLMASGACLDTGSGSSGGGCGDTSSAVDNCGFCGNVCGSQHATPSCAAGLCSLACEISFGDCDLDAKNGCESDLSGDVENCGFCFQACSGNNGIPACSNGACTIACKAGYADCDGYSGNGCEIHLASSSAHCGACGNDCSGGPCVDGVCGPGATQIASGFAAPSALAVDATSIYLVGAQPLGGVAVQIPHGVGNVTCLETSQPPQMGTCGFGIFDGVVVSGSEVFFTSSAGVKRYMPIDGTTALVSSSVAQPWALAVDTNYVFFTSRSMGGVYRVARGALGAVAEEITGAPALVGGALLADADYLYWTIPDGTVVRMHKDGSELQQIASAQAFDGNHLTPQYFGLDEGHLYWSSTGGRLFQIDKDGAHLKVLVDNLSAPAGIAVDPGSTGRLYWVDRGAGTVQSIAKDGTGLTTIAAGQDQPVVIALDAGFVYWATLQGSVLEMAR